MAMARTTLYAESHVARLHIVCLHFSDEDEGELSIPVPQQPQEPGPSEHRPMGFQQPPQPPAGSYQPPPPAPSASQPQPPAPSAYQPQPPAADPYQPTPAPAPRAAAASGSAVSLNFDQIAKAQKYSKLAYSALNYEDIPTAVTNLQKALTLLQTGQDPE